jgi:K+-sensing histidine kinase KdpD
MGRDTLGEGVIALLFLVPVTWSASRWGLVPGISAALTATLCFDFLFIPPFFSFTVANLEGWLVLLIFLGVAIVVVERFQASLNQAREATTMYEFSLALSGQRTQESTAQAAARYIQQFYQADLVKVIYHPGQSTATLVVSEPEGMARNEKPDRIVPVMDARDLTGEIQIWRGKNADLPAEDNRLLKNFAWQVARTLNQTRPLDNNRSGNGISAQTPELSEA